MPPKTLKRSAIIVTGNDQTFTRFPKLPIELRLKIWEYVSDVERDIWIGAKPISEGYRSVKVMLHPLEWGAEEVFKYITSSPPPSILHANQESRSEGLKQYSLAFGTTLKYDGIELNVKPQIYINFQRDRICTSDWLGNPDDSISTWEFLLYQPIRRLAIPWGLNEEIFGCMSVESNGLSLKFWKGIEEMTVYDPACPRNYDLPKNDITIVTPRKSKKSKKSRKVKLSDTIFMTPKPKPMSFSYWALGGTTLADLARCTVPGDIDEQSVWSMAKAAINGGRNQVTVSLSSLDLRKLPDQDITLPVLKIVEFKKGNATRYAKSHEASSFTQGYYLFDNEAYEDLLENEKQ